MNRKSFNEIVSLYRANFIWRYRFLYVVTLLGLFITSNLLIVSIFSLGYSPHLNPYLLMIAVIGLILEYFSKRKSNCPSWVDGEKNGQGTMLEILTPKDIMHLLALHHPWQSMLLSILSVMGVTGICGYLIFPLITLSYSAEWAYFSLGFGFFASVFDVLAARRSEA